MKFLKWLFGLLSAINEADKHERELLKQVDSKRVK